MSDATLARIERYLAKLVRGVTTPEQSRAALEQAWRYYHRLRKEDRRVMLALMLQHTLRHVHAAERRRRGGTVTPAAEVARVRDAVVGRDEDEDAS